MRIIHIEKNPTAALAVTLTILMTLACPPSLTASNFLPNAGFELGLGQGLPTHWADPFNPLTISMAASGQQSVRPSIESTHDAPQGAHIACVQITPGQTLHLTSAAINIEPGRTHTLSAYARSNAPDATLQLALWCRLVDWRHPPDAISAAYPLTENWRRHEFVFTVPTYARHAVVELRMAAPTDAQIDLDAVQLEPGPHATIFAARHPVEADVYAHGKPFNGMLHLMGRPLEIDVGLYNQTDQPAGDLDLVIFDEHDNLVSSKALPEPAPPGKSHQRLSIDFGRVGQYRANLRNKDGHDLAVADYRFIVHPVIAEDEQAIGYSVDGIVSKLAVQRVTLPWQNKFEWYAEPAQHLVVGDDDSIYVFACDGAILRTADGGRTWDQPYEAGDGFAYKSGAVSQFIDAGGATEHVRGPMYAMGAMRNGNFLCAALDPENRRVLINRSTDRGQSWQTVSRIDNIENYQPGAMIELDDGTYLWPVAYPKPGYPHSVYVYRSTDQGNTWKGYPVSPGGEPFVQQLRSGRLLSTVRHNVSAPPHAPELLSLYHDNHWNWLFWQRAHASNNLTSYKKNLILLDSADGGITWSGARDATYGLDEMHGMTVELADGRVVLFYVHRMPYVHGGERAKVSHDAGRTWQPQLYYLHTTPGYPGYSASCLLPPHLADGRNDTILTIVANRAHGGQPTKMQAVRWTAIE